MLDNALKSDKNKEPSISMVLIPYWFNNQHYSYFWHNLRFSLWTDICIIIETYEFYSKFEELTYSLVFFVLTAL